MDCISVCLVSTRLYASFVYLETVYIFAELLVMIATFQLLIVMQHYVMLCNLKLDYSAKGFCKTHNV